MTDTIAIRGLHKRYGSRIALHSLDLRVRPGSVFGLIGPNGAGKTTTLRTLVDMIRPTSGTIRVLDQDPRLGGAGLRRRVGYIPGELRLDGRASGARLLAFYAEVSGADAAGAVHAAHDLADRLGVDLGRPVHALSKGNKQKIGLIQAFMHHPELLILDEPTSGLDPLVQREFLALVHEAKAAGQTILLSSHVLSEIQQTADEVAVLSAGRIVADGDVASLRLGSVRRVRAVIQGADAAAVHAVMGRVPGVEALDLTARGDAVHLATTVDGAIDPFVKALAGFSLRELTIEEPDLEESVLRLYGDATGRQSTAVDDDSSRPRLLADPPSESRAPEGVSASAGGLDRGEAPSRRARRKRGH